MFITLTKICYAKMIKFKQKKMNSPFDELKSRENSKQFVNSILPKWENIKYTQNCIQMQIKRLIS